MTPEAELSELLETIEDHLLGVMCAIRKIRYFIDPPEPKHKNKDEKC